MLEENYCNYDIFARKKNHEKLHIQAALEKGARTRTQKSGINARRRDYRDNFVACQRHGRVQCVCVCVGGCGRILFRFVFLRGKKRGKEWMRGGGRARARYFCRCGVRVALARSLARSR